MTEINIRTSQLYAWINQFIPISKMVPLQGDASSRRYFRVYSQEKSLIAVDAPPISENTRAFVCIAKALNKQGLYVPQVLQVDYTQGFLLLSDLGDTQLLQVLTAASVQGYYRQAIEELVKLQTCAQVAGWQLPLFDQALLNQELTYFHEWYLVKHLGLSLTTTEKTMLTHLYQQLIDSAQQQPQVLVHRDYHSRNLMGLPNGRLGVLDFQDAVIGPLTYDIVSLLKDCYIQWSDSQQNEWLLQFWQLQTQFQHLFSFEQFAQGFDLMGLQRHLKVLGIFARLYQRDNKSGYLKEIPRILGYILAVCDKYPCCYPLRNFINTRVMPHESDVISCRSG